MDKEHQDKIDAQKRLVKYHKGCIQSHTSKLKDAGKGLSQLEAELAEEPKLRPGNYGTKSMLKFVVVAVDGNEVTFLWEGVCDKNKWKTVWNISDISDCFVFIGNIFDDLKARAEDLTRCEANNWTHDRTIRARITCGKIEFSLGRGTDQIFCTLPQQDAIDFILNLQRMEATLKRQKNS